MNQDEDAKGLIDEGNRQGRCGETREREGVKVRVVNTTRHHHLASQMTHDP